MIKIYTNTTHLSFENKDITITASYHDAHLTIIENNFNLVSLIQKENPHCAIIYISPSFEELYKLFDYHIFQYFITPIDMNLLNQEIGRFIDEYHDAQHYLYFPCLFQKVFLKGNDILYIETHYKDIRIVTSNNTYHAHIQHKSLLMDFIDKLNFIHINRSITINQKHILAYMHSYILLDNKERIFYPISSR